MRDWKAVIRAHLEPLPVDPARAGDIVDELAQHVAQHHADLVASGLTDDDALAAALQPLRENARVAAEIARADRRRPAAPEPPPSGHTGIAGAVGRDVRYALRLLARSPGFAAAAIVTLALGIGANTAIFSVVHAVVLRPLPFRDVNRLVVFVGGRPDSKGAVTSTSLPDYEDWSRQATSLDGIGLLSGWTFNLAGRELPERIFGARVTGSLLPLLGTRPILGRVIDPDDDRPERDEVVVLSERVWRRLFDADPGIIGRPLMLEGRPHIVIGVMPSAFRFPTDDTEIWAAIRDNMTGMPRDGRFMAAAARLRPGVTPASAQAEIDAITAQLARSYPQTNAGWRVRLVGIQDAIVGDVKTPLFVLLGAVGLVLLIACANLSSLLLARLTSRSRETAIRRALGASPRRLIAQLVTENLVVSLIGGAAGVALAYAAVRVIVAASPPNIPRLDETRVDAAVLAFAFALSVASGVVPPLLPALRALRADLQPPLKDGFGGYATAGRNRLGGLLVVGEVALAVTLAVAGGLLLKSFSRLTAEPLGFDPARVLSLKVFLTPPRYLTIPQGKAYVREALDRIAEVPGVESVGVVSQLPLGDPSSNERFEIDGRAHAPDRPPTTAFRAVSASYFATLRIPILRGRALSDADGETTPFVIVINDAMARRFWPGQDPIGQHIRWTTEGRDRRWLTIVGVAGDVKTNGLDRAEAPAVYAPYMQRVFTWVRWSAFAVRTHGEPMQYALPIRRALSALDPDQPIFQIAPLEQVVAQSVAERRFHTLLLDVFAGLALALAAVGVYGTIGYWVTERTREIGVRIALGATSRAIGLMVVARSVALSATGVLLGIGLSFATTRALSTLLFHVSPMDPLTLVEAALLVTLTGAAAAYVPARRAARMDPVAVMRGE